MRVFALLPLLGSLLCGGVSAASTASAAGLPETAPVGAPHHTAPAVAEAQAGPGDQATALASGIGPAQVLVIIGIGVCGLIVLTVIALLVWDTHSSRR